jgi:hypothetical protein
MKFELTAERIPVERVEQYLERTIDTSQARFLSFLTGLTIRKDDSVHASCKATYAYGHTQLAYVERTNLMFPPRGLPGFSKIGMYGIVYPDLVDGLATTGVNLRSVVAVHAWQKLVYLNRTVVAANIAIDTVLDPIARQMAYGCMQLCEHPELTSITVSDTFGEDDFNHGVLPPNRMVPVSDQIKGFIETVR